MPGSSWKYVLGGAQVPVPRWARRAPIPGEGRPQPRPQLQSSWALLLPSALLPASLLGEGWFQVWEGVSQGTAALGTGLRNTPWAPPPATFPVQAEGRTRHGLISPCRARSPPCWRGEGSWSACRRGSETAQPDPPSEDAVWAPRPHPRKPPCAEPALPMLTSLGGGERGWDRALQGQLVAVRVSPASLPRPTLTG